MVIFTMKESWLIKNGGTSKKDASLPNQAEIVLVQTLIPNHFRVINDM